MWKVKVKVQVSKKKFHTRLYLDEVKVKFLSCIKKKKKKIYHIPNTVYQSFVLQICPACLGNCLKIKLPRLSSVGA